MQKPFMQTQNPLMPNAIITAIYIPKGFPEIVCLIGSTKFRPEFFEKALEFGRQGKIVLTINWSFEGYQPNPEEKKIFDELHFRKIELAHTVYVINKGGYIGESTRNELNHALSLGKRIEFLVPYEKGNIHA